MEKNCKEINKSDDLIKRSDLLERVRAFTSISSGYFENPELLERVIREMPNAEFKQKVANPPTQETLDFIHENIEVITNTEPSEKEFNIATQGYSKGYSVGKEDGYAQGLNDGRDEVWEFVKKLCDIKYDDSMNVFGCVSTRLILKHFTPQEAIAKLKAYEEAQSKIEVGDIVQYKSIQNEWIDVLCTAIIKHTDDRYEDTLQGILADGTITYNAISGHRKTGKHIDIQSILEQIGEQGRCK